MINTIATLANQAADICVIKYADVKGPVPWAFEEEFARTIAEYCALLYETGVEQKMKPAEIANLIRNL